MERRQGKDLRVMNTPIEHTLLCARKAVEKALADVQTGDPLEAETRLEMAIEAIKRASRHVIILRAILDGHDCQVTILGPKCPTNRCRA